MSNDLISRSALLKEMQEYCGEQRYLIPENVWDMVKNLPTAYDVNKVVERLMCESVNCHLMTYRAVEIVKAGGING